MLKQRRFVNVKSTLKLNVEKTFILDNTENSFIPVLWF